MPGLGAVGMSVTGIELVAKKLEALALATIGTVLNWAWLEGNEALAYSSKIVPVRKGVLKSSGSVSRARLKSGEVLVEVSYGGPAVDYAYKIHEDLTLRHKPGQEAKFLEKGLLSRESQMSATLAKEIGRSLR